jgi:hypothetical protein
MKENMRIPTAMHTLICVEDGSTDKAKKAPFRIAEKELHFHPTIVMYFVLAHPDLADLVLTTSSR